MDEERLKSIPLFAGLSKEERRRIAKSADEVDVRAGKQLVREGDFSYEFFVIESGAVEVKHGDERLAELGPGDFMGEMGLEGRARRNATVEATEPTTVIVMTGREFRQMERDMPEVCRRIRTEVEKRTRTLAE